MGRRLSAREELEEIRARYQCMVEDAPEAISVFSLEKEHFVEVNPAACRLFDATREQLLRTGPVELSPERQPDGRLSRDAVRALIASAMEGEHPIFDWTHLTTKGVPVLCRIQLARVPSPSLGRQLVRGSMVDITATVESARMSARLREILDQTPDYVAMDDPEMRVVWLNPAGRELCGFGPGEEVGQPLADHYAPDDVPRVLEECIPAAIRDGVWRGENRLRARDGRLIPVSQVIIAHKNPQGKLECISTIARDISDRRAATQLERKILHAQKLESLGVLAGGIAHDFNNILVGLLGNASLLARKLAGREEAELAHGLVAAGERAAELAQQLLAYTGHEQVTMDAVDLCELVDGVSQLLAASISKKAHLHFDFAENLPPVRGNQAQLQQIAMNLITNGSDALGDEGGDVTLTTGRVRPDRSLLQYDYLEPDVDECVFLDVTDTGAGMDPALVDRIFDPFFTTKTAGRGLGLAAVLGIVRGHHGGIRVTTAKGKGTRFCVVLPPWHGNAERDEPAPEETEAAHRGGLVLIVDDEEMVRQVVTMTLTELGYETLEAEDGTTAVQMFEERSADIDLVLLDLTMPDLAGDVVLERMRAIRTDVPIVMTSGYPSASTEKADAFLAKPFTIDDLENMVVSLLRRS